MSDNQIKTDLLSISILGHKRICDSTVERLNDNWWIISWKTHASMLDLNSTIRKIKEIKNGGSIF